MIKDIRFYRKDGRVILQKLVARNVSDYKSGELRCELFWEDVQTDDDGVEKNNLNSTT